MTADVRKGADAPTGARRSTRSTPRRSRQARSTTARRDCARATTRITTAPTSSVPTAHNIEAACHTPVSRRRTLASAMQAEGAELDFV